MFQHQLRIRSQHRVSASWTSAGTVIETVSMQENLKSDATCEERSYGGLENMSGFLISLAQAYVFEHFSEELTPKGMRPAQISALILIRENPGIRHGELAEMLKLKLAYTTKLIKSFEADGWVRREQSEEDRRAIQLYLTPEGAAFVDAMKPVLTESDAARPSGLTARETQQLMRLLRKYLGMDVPGATAD